MDPVVPTERRVSERRLSKPVSRRWVAILLAIPYVMQAVLAGFGIWLVGQQNDTNTVIEKEIRPVIQQVTVTQSCTTENEERCKVLLGLLLDQVTAGQLRAALNRIEEQAGRDRPVLDPDGRSGTTTAQAPGSPGSRVKTPPGTTGTPRATTQAPAGPAEGTGGPTTTAVATPPATPRTTPSGNGEGESADPRPGPTTTSAGQSPSSTAPVPALPPPAPQVDLLPQPLDDLVCSLPVTLCG